LTAKLLLSTIFDWAQAPISLTLFSLLARLTQQSRQLTC